VVTREEVTSSASPPLLTPLALPSILSLSHLAKRTLRCWNTTVCFLESTDHQTFQNNILLKRLKSVPHTEPGDADQEQNIKYSTSKQLLFLLGAGVINVYRCTTSASAKRDKTGNHICKTGQWAKHLTLI